ncbi:hypothetical protein [Sphingobium sp. CAP-1]|uniref:hypothetical protein n=1 Tax=Sphingobium sp. CAP-1 TaxID=2676077 RepID=UPI0012BB2A68|nr:hypothetical protein [Sphingobium sp. CAP-1]QGP80028.1 hypothetical protein GL174_14305 [Sphingobium sp. CAP-1]
MMRLRPSVILWAYLALYCGMLFVAFRIAVPALINMQNDGALVLAVALMAGVALIPFLTWPAIADLIEEISDED